MSVFFEFTPKIFCIAIFFTFFCGKRKTTLGASSKKNLSYPVSRTYFRVCTHRVLHRYVCVSMLYITMCGISISITTLYVQVQKNDI